MGATNDQAVCNEQFRVAAKCAFCGPNWGNLGKCKRLCDAEPACKFLTYFSDHGCRMYTACDPTWPQVYNVITSIYEKGAAIVAPGGAATDQIASIMDVPVVPTPAPAA